MKIALFGGAFDPFHTGHSQVISSLVENQIADEVWCLPVKNHSFGKNMLPVYHRLAMLQLAVAGQLHVRIEEYELRQEGVNYTYATMMALSLHYPHHSFSFVIGSDNLKDFHRWIEKHPQLLDFPFYIYPREHFPFEPLYPHMTALEGMRTVTISSTQVRQLRAQGKSIAGLVEPAVERYIQEHALYFS